MFLVALLNRWYWILGGLLGAVFGGLADFNAKGLDFALTAMFAVIFLNQWQTRGNRPGALAGLACSAACLLLLGPQGFVIPAMALMLAVLGVMAKKAESL
jgi:4-azaleucine resistance transporter AzlC